MASTKRVAVICASNQNRSMETHQLFKARGVPNVSSFGTGSQVKMPGQTRTQPNVYDFSTTYQAIYDDLVSKDALLYVKSTIFFACNFAFVLIFFLTFYNLFVYIMIATRVKVY